ncbi:MAG: hypothetical protein QNJ26_03670 [Desulfobacterales bacterium]|nr:hypothetical protein [Desulfobacterales bacterium]
MTLLEKYLTSLICGLLLLGMPTTGSSDPAESVTEAACARLPAAEIIWDLSQYRWLCCTPKSNDEYESCVPISDMQPLPKTNLKPFPTDETQTIEKNPRKP